LSLRDNTRVWETRILLCLLILAPFLLTPWVHGDGIGSVAFLRSAVVDRNLDLTNEFAYLSTHMAADAGGLPGHMLSKSDYDPGLDVSYHRSSTDPVTGRTPFFATIGPPILWSPAYLLSHALSQAAAALGAEVRTDGYGGLYYLAIALTTFGCGLLGLILLFRLVNEVAPKNESFWAVMSVALASPLVYYLYLAPTYPHSMTILSTGAFFLYWWRNRGSRGAGNWFVWGLLTGFLFLVRWNDAVIAVPALALEMARYVRRGPSAWGELATRVAYLFAGFFLVISVQLLSWQYFHARPLVRYPVTTLGFWPEGLLGTFVSSRHGLFIWHPITILGVLGVFRLFARNRELAGVCLATLALVVVTNCMILNWWGGASFGMRRLLSASPVFALGLGAIYEDIRVALGRERMAAAGRRVRLTVPAIVSAFSVWNVLLLLQYALGMIGHTGAVPFSTIAANQPKIIVKVIRLLGELLR
jgi:hypothetical protein